MRLVPSVCLCVRPLIARGLALPSAIDTLSTDGAIIILVLPVYVVCLCVCNPGGHMQIIAQMRLFQYRNVGAYLRSKVALDCETHRLK